MKTIYHDLAVPILELPAATLKIDGESLIVRGGHWPDVGGVAVQVQGAQIALEEDDCAVALRRPDGEGPCAVEALTETPAYGLRMVGPGRYVVQRYVDLLAWREADGWHVKRLAQGGD